MKRYKQKFEEVILSVPTEFNTDNPNDSDILRIAISAEQSAITLYNQLADVAQDDQLRNVLLDVAKEEKVHIGEFQTLLYSLDPEEYESHLEGEREVEEI